MIAANVCQDGSSERRAGDAALSQCMRRDFDDRHLGTAVARFGQKAHSVRELRRVPARPRRRVLAALAIHPDERRDLEALAKLSAGFSGRAAEQAVAALLAIKGEKMSEAELDRMSRLIDAAKKEGR